MDRSVLVWAAMGLGTSMAISFLNLDAAPLSLPVLSAMPRIVRSIELWRAGSEYPQFTVVFFSTMWLASPSLAWLMLRRSSDFFPAQQLSRSRRIQKAAAAVLVAAAFLAVAVFGFGSDHLPATAWQVRRSIRGLVLGSRLSAGLFGSLLIFFTWYCVLAAAIYSAHIFKGEKS